MQRGCFVSIEGGEGVGKSTHLVLIESILADYNIPYVATRELGGTPIAEKIRTLFLDKQHAALTDMSELLLVFAARTQHFQELIKPALDRGQWVICDRFTDSTFAYQGGGRGIPTSTIEALNALSLDSFMPDLTILLDLPIEIGLDRAGKRVDRDRLELEDEGFFNRVRQQFLHRAEHDPGRFRILNANQDLAKVQATLSLLLRDWIQGWSA